MSSKFLRLLGNPILKARLTGIPSQLGPLASITTGKKAGDTSAATTEITKEPEIPQYGTNRTQYWVGYGYDPNDPIEDERKRRVVMFSTVTIGIVLFGFLMAYYPDTALKHWGQREAYIELARRESLGLPIIDPDLVPRDQINLPSEEELGDFEIII